MTNRLWLLMSVLLSVGGYVKSQAAPEAAEPECSVQDTTFELRTGYVLTSPEEILDTKPDTLQLADCIENCRINSSCSALNFETGLCVLFRTNALDAPGKLFLLILLSSFYFLMIVFNMVGLLHFDPILHPCQVIVFSLSFETASKVKSLDAFC